MPYYRIILKIEKQEKIACVTEFPDRDIDSVYEMFEKRVNEKYGAGRVEYFNVVMVAKKTIGKDLPTLHKIIQVPKDDFGLDDPIPEMKWQGKKRKGFDGAPPLRDRPR